MNGAVNTRHNTLLPMNGAIMMLPYDISAFCSYAILHDATVGYVVTLRYQVSRHRRYTGTRHGGLSVIGCETGEIIHCLRLVIGFLAITQYYYRHLSVSFGIGGRPLLNEDMPLSAAWLQQSGGASHCQHYR